MLVLNKIIDLPQIDFDKKEKLWDREYSPFTLYAYAYAMNVLKKDEIGKKIINNYSEAIFIHVNAKTIQYRDYNEDENMTEMVSVILKDNKKFREGLFRQYVYNCQKIEKYFSLIKTKDDFDYSFIRSYNRAFSRMAAYVLPIQRCVDYMKDHYQEYESIFKKLIELRQKYEYIFGGAYEKHLDILCQKIAKRLNIADYQTLKFLTLKEFKNLLDNKKLPNDLESRKELSIVLVKTNDNLSLLIHGKAAHFLYNQLLKADQKRTKKISQEKKLKGLVAYKRNIKGKVQVIKDFKDLDKFKKGNILVCTSTLPKYEPYYKKAVAIISDEGGLLSHVAIFCREFKIPGIIGTKLATNILKDGDIVAIDADKGIVKIINN